MQASRTTAVCFGEEHFGGTRLADRRRNRRLAALANHMAKHPGGTLPDKVKNPADLKALYRMMDSDAVTHEEVLRPHVHRTLDLMRRHDGVMLILHDTTELDYSGLKSLKNILGQIGNGGGRGYKCHNSLAVTAEPREVLGLTNQVLLYLFTVPATDNRSPDRKGGVAMVCEIATNERTHDRLLHSPSPHSARPSFADLRVIFKHSRAIIGLP